MLNRVVRDILSNKVTRVIEELTGRDGKVPTGTTGNVHPPPNQGVRSAARASKTTRDYIPKDFADWREIPSEALEQRELREALTKALESRPEKYRTVLILRDVQHLSINETAKALGLSEANVKTRLSRARLQMRDALAPGFDGAWSRGRSYEKVRPF
jgi:RNA polymerase sigma factor (sigma-70 family)